MIEELCDRFSIGRPLRAAALRAQGRVAEMDYPAQRAVSASVLQAFLDEGITDADLDGGYGYGYDDAARARYESLLAKIFGAERALARLSLVSGTHAIVGALAACTPPGTTLLSISGSPYDTLRNAIVDAPHSLVKQGVVYREIPLIEGRAIDVEAVQAALAVADASTVFIQRSRGYAPRRSLSVDQCGEACAAVRSASTDAIVIVDNCYGELVETREPTHAGADVAVGSLIKNLGGSLAPAGGYVAGRAHIVDRIADRVYAPGLGAKLGPSLGFGRTFVQGLFIAPLIVEQCLRGLDFFAALFDELGYGVDPVAGERRTDIVQAIRLGSPALLERFARGLQSALPVNARFRPEAGAVPGYLDPVIMSSGAFVAGATIELSCDAPLRPPFEVYVQGGVVATYAFTGALFAARAIVEKI